MMPYGWGGDWHDWRRIAFAFVASIVVVGAAGTSLSAGQGMCGKKGKMQFGFSSFRMFLRGAISDMRLNFVDMLATVQRCGLPNNIAGWCLRQVTPSVAVWRECFVNKYAIVV